MKVDPDCTGVAFDRPGSVRLPMDLHGRTRRSGPKRRGDPRIAEYLLNGGVLMADDFWGQKQWDNFERNIKRVLPEREFSELPMDHPPVSLRVRS